MFVHDHRILQVLGRKTLFTQACLYLETLAATFRCAEMKFWIY